MAPAPTRPAEDRTLRHAATLARDDLVEGELLGQGQIEPFETALGVAGDEGVAQRGSA